MSELTIRPAYPDDLPDLQRLAALDSATVPGGELLIAELDGVLAAAVSIDDQGVIADPFRPTAAVVDLLARRARQFRPETAGRWWERWLPAQAGFTTSSIRRLRLSTTKTSRIGQIVGHVSRVQGEMDYASAAYWRSGRAPSSRVVSPRRSDRRAGAALGIRTARLLQRE